MAEKFLEPQNPLKKIDETTGDVTYVYPLTTDKQVIMENGERLSTVLKENILYMGETAEESVAEVINADTLGGKTEDMLIVSDSAKLGGQSPSYYASADSVVKKNEFLDMVYPVGAIYMSITSTSPATLFGGTWERIKDTFLLSAGDTYSAGATGGEATHTLTVDEMPKHLHYYNSYQQGYPSAYTGAENYKTPVVHFGTSHDGAGVENTHSNYTGGSQPHNNMPPYLAVYVWQRTA